MTQVRIDDKLIEQARKVGKHRTRDSAVRAALRNTSGIANGPGILDLVGQVDYRTDYDHKQLRKKNPR